MRAAVLRPGSTVGFNDWGTHKNKKQIRAFYSPRAFSWGRNPLTQGAFSWYRMDCSGSNILSMKNLIQSWNRSIGIVIAYLNESKMKQISHNEQFLLIQTYHHWPIGFRWSRLSINTLEDAIRSLVLQLKIDLNQYLYLKEHNICPAALIKLRYHVNEL